MLYHLISPLLGAQPICILLKAIFDQYLSSSFCLTIVSEEPVEFNFNLSFTSIVPKSSVEELYIQLLDVSEKGCSDYIVTIKNPQMFMTAFDKVSQIGNTRRSDRKIIFLPHTETHNNNSLDIISMREADFVFNILIILPLMESKSDCVTYDLVTRNIAASEINQPLYLDQWNSCTKKFTKNANLFPHDMKNLHGKTVKVACFTYKPYVLLDLDMNIAPQGRDGTEMRIVEEYCRWSNCTIEVVREDEAEWGAISENRTGTGVLGSLAEDRADMGISALYSWFEEFIYLDFSASAIRSAITCVAPSPRLLASWDMPLMPFSPYMWYAMLFTFILASIALTMARGSTDRVLLTIFGILITQSQPSVESTWRVRSVTGYLIGAAIILVSAYGGGLASTFTVPKYEASIDTVQDLIDRKMEWGATSDAWIFSLTLSNEPRIKQLVSQFKIYQTEELKSKSFTRSMAFSVEKLPAGNFAIGDYLTSEALLDFTLMLEDFYYEQCVVMMRKSSPYTETMSALVGRLHQSGLLLAWETQIALKHLNFKVQQEVKLSRSKTDVGFTRPLSSSDVIGVFALYLVGIILSVLVFIGEILTWKIFKSNTRIRL